MFDEVAVDAEFFGGEADAFIEIGAGGCGVEDSDHDFFAEEGWENGDAEIDFFAVEFDFGASVLRFSALGDIEFADNFYTGYDCGKKIGGNAHDFAEYAVNAVSKLDFVCFGFEVDIAGACFYGVGDGHVDQLDDGDHFGVSLEFFFGLLALFVIPEYGNFVIAGEVFVNVVYPFVEVVSLFDGIEYVCAGDYEGFYIETGDLSDIVFGDDIEGVGHCAQEYGVFDSDGYEAVFLGDIVGYEFDDFGVGNPVEYQLDGINQIQINEAAGITFATSLRSILRQDPNVVLVGEIRDLETAEIAFQASQTGHLVLSTLHTNNTISTITRLVDIGVEHYLIASSVIGIVAQRLIRKLCPTCRQPYQPDQEKLASLGIAPGQHQFYKEQGCGQCGFTGFSGRTAIFEILEVGEETKNLISSRRPENEIFDGARAGGMRLLAEVGIEKAKAGVTSLEEVQRVASFGELTDIYCPQCNNRITKEFSTCPYCSYKLMQLYPNCSQKINSNWNTCPYCGSGVSTPHKHQAPPVAPTPKQELPVVPATPQQDQRSEHTPHSGHHENPAGNHFKLLAVDDDPNVRQIIRATFRNDFHVIEAVDGIEGLEKAHKESPDIMIVDVMMPNMSGFELCRHLRSNLATGSIPIVMLTAKTDLKSEAEGLDAGADDYLTKPFEPQRLALRVKALLSRHHQHFASATQ